MPPAHQIPRHQTGRRARLIAAALVFIGTSVGLAVGFAAAAPDNSTAIEVVRGAILVRVWINGQGPLAFVLDTGARAPVIAEGTARALRLPAVSNSQAAREYPAVSVASLRIANAVLNDQHCTVRDLTPFSERLGMRIAGIAAPPGGDFGMVLDLPAKRLEFPQGLITDTGPPRGLRVHILLNGTHSLQATVDTSFAEMLGLSEQQASEIGALTGNTPCLTSGAGDGSGVTLPSATRFRIASLSVGPVKVLRPVCSLRAPGEPAVVGVAFLQLCRLTVRNGGRRIDLEPVTPMPYTDPPITGFGLGLISIQDGYWTLAVNQNSAASRAGIHPMDRLIEVNGQNLRGAPFEKAIATLSAGSGTVAHFVVEHAGVRSTFTLRAEPML